MQRFLLFLVFEMCCAGAASAGAWSAYNSARVDALVQRFLTVASPQSPSAVPSLSIAVGVDGRLAFAKGYGEARPGYPATEHSVYHIGSLTKQFTAAAVLRLLERGAKVPVTGVPSALSTPISEIFDGVESWSAGQSRPITIRGLLTMTSGLPSLTEHPPLAADPWGTITAGQMLAELKKLSRQEQESGFAYNNTSYFLLAQIIEAVSGAGAESYRTYMREAVIQRAGLKDTGFIDDYAVGTALAVATPSWGSDTPNSRRRPAYVQADWLKGSADMASSAFDLFAWNRALMEDEIVGVASRELMFSDAARVGASRYYGMGWFIEHAGGEDRFSHTGYVPGFSALNMIVRRRDGSWRSVSLLTNRDGVRGLEKLAAGIAEVASNP